MTIGATENANLCQDDGSTCGARPWQGPADCGGFQQIFEHRPSWGKLVTPRLARARPIYRWFVYPHSFDKELVSELLDEIGLVKGDRVWDPFVGAGTTLLACQERGFRSVGTDILPLSVLVSGAKTSRYAPHELRETRADLLARGSCCTTDRFGRIPVVEAAIPKDIRLRLSGLLNRIEAHSEPVRAFFTVALLSIIGDVSYSVKSGGWLRLDMEKDINVDDVDKLFSAKTASMIDDVETAGGASRICDAAARVGDARTVALGEEFHGVVSSPPYLNRHDYTRVFALELALTEALDEAGLKALRYRTLRSHVEAQAPRDVCNKYQEPARLSQCLREMEANGINDRRVPRMIQGYFEDMYRVLMNVHKHLQGGGTAALILGDVRFSGVMIPVTELVLQLGDSIGLTPIKVIVTRFRGNSAQQMRDYGRQKAPENVLILRKR